jgi:hypothetical protein
VKSDVGDGEAVVVVLLEEREPRPDVIEENPTFLCPQGEEAVLGIDRSAIDPPRCRLPRRHEATQL